MNFNNHSAPQQGVAGLTGAGGVKLPKGGDLPRYPGAFNIDLTNPVASAMKNQQESDQVISGLGQMIAGEGTGSILGGVPILGPALRGVASIPGVGIPAAIAGKALGMGVGAAASVLSSIPTGPLPGIGSDAIFEALPHTPEWTAVNEAAKMDSWAGGGDRKFEYNKKYWEHQQEFMKDPNGLATLSPGLMAGAGGSLGSMVGQLMGVAQLPQRIVERGLAGTAKVLSGENRVQETLHNAEVGNKLTPVEEAVVSHIHDGSWTEQRALDFMASHGAGLSRNEVLQITGSFATDPTVLASLGTAGLARLAARGGMLASQGFGAGQAIGLNAGRFARGSATATFLDSAGLVGAGIRASDAAKVFKVARTIIDPLSAIGGKTVAGQATLDLFTDAVATKGFHYTHLSDGGASAYRTAAALGLNVDAMQVAAGGRGASYANQVLATMRQGAMILDNNAMTLFSPLQAAQAMAKVAPKQVMQIMHDLIYAHRTAQWTPELKNALVGRLAASFPSDAGVDTEKLTAYITGKAGDAELGFLDDLLYAGEEGMFRKAVAASAMEYQGKVDINRLNMFDHTTLTDLGARGFLKRLGISNPEADAALAELKSTFNSAKKKASPEGKAALAAYTAKYPGPMDVMSSEAAAELAALQKSFPETGQYGDNVQFAIDDLTRRLAAGLDGDLPHQVTGDEMGQMGKRVQDFFRDNPHRTLGFRPPQDQLWNFTKNPVTGLLEAAGDPWVEHVLEGVTYRPGFQLPFNLAGQVVPGPIGKALDWLEAGPRLMNKRISGAMKMANSEQRFVKSALAGGKGMTEQAARKIFDALTQHANAIKYPTVTSLPVSDINNVATIALQDLAVGHGLTERDFLRWVVEGFEGDLSIVGLGQKIPNKLRTWSAELTGSNFMYEITQKLYGELKFRGPLAFKFKAQEAIEPYIINAAEGTRLGREASATARELGATMKNLRDTSLIGGLDQTELFEQQQWSLGGAQAHSPDANLLRRILNPNIIESKFRAQTEMMAARLGTAVRQQFESAGRLDEFLEGQRAYAQAVKRPVSDSEYAQWWLNSQHTAVTPLGKDGWHINWDEIRAEANTWSPVGVGPVRKLALDLGAAKLNGLNGHVIEDLADLTDAMVPGRKVTAAAVITEADIRRHLAIHAPTEYVDRFIRAIRFNYKDFWVNLTAKYNLSPADVTALQSYIDDTARLQNVTPVELLSQVFARGETSVVGALKVLRGERKTAGALFEDMSDAFRETLHPSGTAALDRAMGAVSGFMPPPSGFRASTADEFKRAVERAAATTKSNGRQVSETLYVYPDYSGMRTFLSSDGLTGYAIKTDGDLVSVFNIGEKGRIEKIVPTFRGQGAVKLDAFDEGGRLPELYGKGGFREVRREPFDPTQAPPNWTGGTPDVVFMEASPAVAPTGIAARPPVAKGITIKIPGEPDHVVNDAIGPGLKAQPEPVRAALIAEVDRLEEATGIRIDHLDVQPSPGVAGETFRTSGGGSAIYLDTSANEAKRAAEHAASRKKADFPNTGPIGPARIPRESYPGVPYGADPTMLGDLRHEFGHAVQNVVMKRGGAQKYRAVRDFLARFDGSPAARQMSEHATINSSESAAEVIGVALDPNADLSVFKATAAKATRLKGDLRDVPADLRPGYAGVAGAPQTAAAAVVELRQLLADAGLLRSPSGVTDAFTKRVLDRAASGVIDADPNLENAYRYYADWIRSTAKSLNRPEAIDMVKNIPSGGVPYDHTQGALLDGVYARIRQMETETYRAQFYARERPLWERSLNHPMFGLYPASYMWVKIMPMLIRFIADKPFGLKTGALAYSLADMQKDVAIQREFDPEFGKMLDGVGKSQLLWFLSLMMPATPWDIPSSWPKWVRDTAGQGLANQRLAEKGRPAKGIDLGSIAGSSLSPIELQNVSGLNASKGAVSELGDTLFGSQKEQTKRPGRVGLTSAIAPAAQQLAEPLSNAMDQLQSSLGG